ncbi:ornithine N5 monooxygenase [Schizosaccharomyces japonicus yFS275]|uniref:L-ornithine N(5)-monooxygenase [NAD(P)H] n=1 Tax=Schizosaccharomyces japonicus (strain yFS275 / FY16936) TaxID=402676 RepID=B6K5Q7_SCHJY|nr:ornithine N5 monooxygenase [Schizosaccharomyces japonicus yFS275]EEB08861.1 ornithine N5 monooxygenase [Schizosaccharomyces japonicus yFS275]
MVDLKKNDILDLIIIGMGPASLSILIAAYEHSSQPLKERRIRVFEKQQEFSWHRGMLIPGSNMQISFVKDLASPRNPRSYFSFLNFLHVHGCERFHGFLNMSVMEPSRSEFHEYLSWCASHFESLVQYDSEVASMDYDESSDTYTLSVKQSDGTCKSVRTKNVLVATGGQPCIPEQFRKLNTGRIRHSSEFMYPESQSYLQNAKHGVLVVGAGQSAAEIWRHCHNNVPLKLPVHMSLRSLAPLPSDSSPFINSLFFDPDRAQWWYRLPECQRLPGLASGRGTNYGVVKEGLIEEMFRIVYDQKRYTSQPTHTLLPYSFVDDIEPVEDGLEVTITFQDPQRKPTKLVQKYDVVYFATGYNHNGGHDLIRKFIPPGEKAIVHENYVLSSEPSKQGHLYLVGLSESQHGIGETLLSWAAVRAGNIVNSIFGPNKSTEDFSL